MDPESISGLNLYCYCANDPINHIYPDGYAWYHWAIGAVAPPAIASYASTMAVAYTGIVGLGSVAATAVSVGAGFLAVGTVAIGVNEGVAALTGYNAGRELMGDGVYDAVSTIVTLGGATYIAGGMTLPYPSTGNTGSNLRHQLAIEEASSNPNEGDVIPNIKMKDPRMPYWLGWQKYSYQVYDMHVHYVGNRLFPKWYPYSPWFDYKIK